MTKALSLIIPYLLQDLMDEAQDLDKVSFGTLEEVRSIAILLYKINYPRREIYFNNFMMSLIQNQMYK